MNWERYRALVTLGDSGKSEEALPGLQSLLAEALAPDEKAAILVAIGRCLRDLGCRSEAQLTVQRAETLVSEDNEIFAWALFADACLDADAASWKEALAKFDVLALKFSLLFLLKENQDSWEHIQRMRGIALFELGRPSEARPLLEQAATRETEKATVLYYLARCHYELGDFDQSKQSLRESLALNLDVAYQVSAHYLLGLIHYGQGQYAWALRELEWCLENGGQGSKDVPREYILRNLAKASIALGLLHDAERYSRML